MRLYPRLGFDILGGLFDVGRVQLPTGYKPAISFVILIIVLLIRPVGILGKP